MTAGTTHVLERRGEKARAWPWQGDAGVAYLSPLPSGRSLTAPFIRHCLDELAGRGYSKVLSPALSPIEQLGFVGAGFVVAEELCVLTHDLRELPEPRGEDGQPKEWTTLRVRSADWGRVLEVDHEAFDTFWRLDCTGLREAVKATPRSRVRAAAPLRRGPVPGPDTAPSGRPGELMGYAVTGMSRGQGFLQRLAVHPAHQGQGVGFDLCLDAIRWLRRWRVQSAHVNTHPENAAALSLYETLGFRRAPLGLAVLTAPLGT